MAQVRIEGVCTRADILLGQMPDHWRRVMTSPLPRSINRSLPRGQWAEVTNGLVTVRQAADGGGSTVVGTGELSGRIRARVHVMDQKQGIYGPDGKKYTAFVWAVTLTLNEDG